MAQIGTGTNVGRAGRKRASSRAMLEEAACELFLENTYAGTTIEQIAQRAGVSRNTFFNYFEAKSDVLWASVDEGILSLNEELAAVDASASVLEGMRSAVVRTAARFGSGQLPLAATQYEVMGAVEELRISGFPRFLRLATAVERHLDARLESAAREHAQTIAFAVVAAAVAAAAAWARAGVLRRPLAEHVEEAISPICEGFQRAFDAAGTSG